MNKTYRLDFSTTFLFSFMIVAYIYTFFIFEGLSILTLLLRYAFLAFIALLFLLVFSRNVLSKKDIIILFPFFIFNVLYVFRIETADAQTIVSIIIQVSFVMLMYIFYVIDWKKYQIKLFSSMAFIIFPLLLISLFFDLINTNTIGSYAYFLAFFPLLYLVGYNESYTKFKITILVALTFSIIFFSETRSIFIAVAFSIITLSLWKIITSKKIWFNLYFFLILAFNYFIIVLYPKIYTLKNFDYYNYLSIKYTGKRLLSGRNEIWETLIEFIKLKPYLGYGAGADPRNFIASDLSAHNLYIQVSLQVGLIGLSLLLLFLFFIWKSFWNNRHDPRVVIASCYFIGILTYQLFEVTLTQNNFGLGLLQWIIMGLGLSFAFNKIKPRPQ